MILAITILGVVLVLLVWHKLGDPIQKPETQMMAEARLRRDKLNLLREAYALAKEELGEEPTAEQIILTRDTLLAQKELG